jgi:pectate lyase
MHNRRIHLIPAICTTVTVALVAIPTLLVSAHGATEVSTTRLERTGDGRSWREWPSRRGQPHRRWRSRPEQPVATPTPEPTPTTDPTLPTTDPTAPSSDPTLPSTDPGGPLPTPTPTLLPDAFPTPAPASVPGATDGPTGFGRSATGGANGVAYWVTTLADSGPGSLRVAAESSQALRIGFRVSGVINLKTPLRVGSNKTIDAAGANVTISNQGFILSGVSNVVIRNLTFRGGSGSTTDAIGIRNEAQNIWIDHSDFASYPDGLIDITRGGTNVTISWSKFSDQDKVMLINGEASDGHTVAYSPNVTIHHNWFEGTYQRNPRALHGLVQAYNNYLHNWGGYGMRASEGGQLVSEGNIFEMGSDERALLTQAGGNDTSGGLAVSVGDWVVNPSTRVQVSADGDVFNPSDYYTYTVEVADATLRDRIMAEAGVQG